MILFSRNLLQEIVSIIFQFSLIITFITFFFFTYVKKTEEDIVNQQVDTIMAEFGNELRAVSPTLLQSIKENINKQLDVPDQSIIDNNNRLFKSTLNFLIPVVGVCIFVSLTLIYTFGLSLKITLINAFSGLAVVALIEFIFITVFAKNFRTVDSNAIKKSVVEQLQKLRNIDCSGEKCVNKI